MKIWRGLISQRIDGVLGIPYNGGMALRWRTLIHVFSDLKDMVEDIVSSVCPKLFQKMMRVLRKWLHQRHIIVYQTKPMKPANRNELRAMVLHEIYMNGPGVDLNHIDVSGLDSMMFVFHHVDFQGDISRWDVSNVTDMRHMFEQCSFSGDISQWNVSKVTNMTHLFESSAFRGDISNWDTSNVTDMSWMFYDAIFDGDISQWNVSNVTDMHCMFRGSWFNGDISGWDVSKVQLMYGMFQDCEHFQGDLSKWNLISLRKVDRVFYQAAHPLVLHLRDLKQLETYEAACSQWSPCALAYLSILEGYCHFPQDHSLAGEFQRWHGIVESLRLPVPERAMYLFEQLHHPLVGEVTLDDDASLLF